MASFRTAGRSSTGCRSRPNLRPPSRGFSLIELSVVVCVIAVLLGLMLPAVQASREASRRAQCTSQVKAHVQAANDFELIRGTYPKNEEARVGIDLAPFMGFANAVAGYDRGRGPVDEPNAAILRRLVPIARCPSDDFEITHPDSYDVTTYPFLGELIGRTQADVTDGTSNTAFFTELRSTPDLVRARGLGPLFDTILPSAALHGRGRNGVVIGYGDGSVEWGSPDCDWTVLDAIVTVSGGEIICVRQ